MLHVMHLVLLYTRAHQTMVEEETLVEKTLSTSVLEDILLRFQNRCKCR